MSLGSDFIPLPRRRLEHAAKIVGEMRPQNSHSVVRRSACKARHAVSAATTFRELCPKPSLSPMDGGTLQRDMGNNSNRAISRDLARVLPWGRALPGRRFNRDAGLQVSNRRVNQNNLRGEIAEHVNCGR